MNAQQDKGGRTMGVDTVRRQLARTLNPRAQQLGEAVLAKALMGDATAQLAAVQLLKLANQPRDKWGNGWCPPPTPPLAVDVASDGPPP